MSTFLGIVRSYAAAVNRAEKIRQREFREKKKQDAADIIRKSLLEAIQTVNGSEKYIEKLKSLHKEVSDKIDWQAIKSEPPPSPPEYSNTFERQAQANLDLFKPNLIGKVFGAKRKIQQLESDIQVAMLKDQKTNADIIIKYEDDKKSWDKFQQLSKGILEKNTESYKEAVEYLNPFKDIPLLGSYVNLHFEKKYIIVDLSVNSSEIIPKEIFAQTSTGKLSKKNMLISRFNRLYQDYICSAVLRTGREVLSLLPVQFTVINAQAELLNTATGKLEAQTILSVAIFPETLEKLNLAAIDPSDSMTNFVHKMKFTNINGFSGTEKVQADSILTNEL